MSVASHVFILTFNFSFSALPIFPTWFDFSAVRTLYIPIFALTSHVAFVNPYYNHFSLSISRFLFAMSPLYPPTTSRFTPLNCSPPTFYLPCLTFHFLTSFEFPHPTFPLTFPSSHFLFIFMTSFCEGAEVLGPFQ